MRNLKQRIERAGFFLFLLGFFFLAVGVAQGITLLRNIGLVVILVIVITIIFRAIRDVTGAPRRPPQDDTKPR